MNRNRPVLYLAIIILLSTCLSFPAKSSGKTTENDTRQLGAIPDIKMSGYYYRAPETITYKSEITGTYRHATVFLPANYSRNRKYPVLYLFHGLNGDHMSWKNKSADIILQNLQYKGIANEMIVVCPNSAVNEKESTCGLLPHDKEKAYDLTGREVVENLMPVIESRYPVKKGRDNTAVAGNSMGGRNALYTAFTYPDLFGYVGVFSSAYVLGHKGDGGKWDPLLETLRLPEDTSDFRLLMLCVGKSDNRCGSVTYRLHDIMKSEKLNHVFHDMPGGHDNSVWKRSLYDFAAQLFK